MNVLFLSYWGLHDPLTVSTVFPHLRLLQQLSAVQRIVLVTIERNAVEEGLLQFEPGFEIPKITFSPLCSKQNQPLLLTKLDDFVRFPRELIALIQYHAIDAIVSRGAPAGALAYLVWKKIKTPFIVESFEPHADYMLESGVWKRFDPRYIFEQYWEHKQKKLAAGLLPVAENYRQQLISEGVSASRIVTVPCSVNLQAFQFEEVARWRVREQLALAAENVVGIYVGKFGGMYYEAEAFELFRKAAMFFGPLFRLVVLTPTPVTQVQTQLRATGFDLTQVFVTKVPPAEVPAYLAAADFAFATYKKGPAKKFLSPIKVGEYWAAGLPVLLTEGVGDDTAIIQAEGGGAVFDVSQPATIIAAFEQVQRLLQQPHHRTTIAQLAARHRNAGQARIAYEQLLLPLASR